MKLIKIGSSGLLGIWLAGVVWADQAIITPNGRNLAPGQFAFEFENQQASEGDRRYYMFRYGLTQDWEVSTITLDEDFDAGGQNTALNLQYQYTPESPYGAGLTLGIWDLQDQDDEGLGRSYYLATGRTTQRAEVQVTEHLGYGWSGHLLDGFFGGVVYRTLKGYEWALERSPFTGFNVQGRYNLSDQFQLRAGSFDGDFTFGVLFQTELKGKRRRSWW